MITHTATLHGSLCGVTWQGYEGCIDIPAQIIDRKEPLAKALERIISRHGGDFVAASFTADSFFQITKREARGNKVTIVQRIVEIATLPSLARFVNPACISLDFDK